MEMNESNLNLDGASLTGVDVAPTRPARISFFGRMMARLKPAAQIPQAAHANIAGPETLREPRAYPQAPLRVDGAAQPMIVGGDQRVAAGKGKLTEVAALKKQTGVVSKMLVEPVEPLAGVWLTTAAKSKAGVPQRTNLTPSQRAAKVSAPRRVESSGVAYRTYIVE